MVSSQLAAGPPTLCRDTPSVSVMANAGQHSELYPVATGGIKEPIPPPDISTHLLHT